MNRSKNGKKKYLTKEDIKNLNYVRVKNTTINIENFPDFLIIGPQRTGTTWLHANLKKNPRIFMSTPKEIHYFSILGRSAPKKLSKSFHPDISYYINFFNGKERSIFKRFAKFLAKNLKKNRSIMRGESSATYAMLNKDVIRDILIINPNIKIIMLVRNPIDRAWSHLKLKMLVNDKINYTHKNEFKDINDIPSKKMIEFFNNNWVSKCGFYSEIIDRWSSLLKKENFFVGSFIDIEKNPAKLLNEIHDFLGVNFNQEHFEKSMKRKINISNSDKIPSEIETLLKERYNDEINLLRGKYHIDL